MKLTGLVTEYNPFHNGHMYHLNKSKELSGADGIVVVMSGNFVQRGTPALLDKWTRTEMALKGGADLVIELPTVYATGSAEIFALGAVRILDGLNQVDNLVFGSESGTITPLKEIAHYLHKESHAFKEALKHELNLGHAFPVAREKALEKLSIQGKMPSLPNDILGIEYLKAGFRLNSKMTFDTIQRVSSAYHDTDTDTALSSATAIRKAYFDNRLDEISHTLPKASYDVLRRDCHLTVSPESLGSFLLYKLRTTPTEKLEKIQDVGEGLEYRMKDAALRAKSYDQLLDLIKTKRYVRTRVQRALLNTLLNVETGFVKSVIHSEVAAYARILGFNDKGRQIMKQLRKTSNIPLITNINKHTHEDPLVQAMLDLDTRATDVYTLLRGDGTGALDRLTQPVYLKDQAD